MRWPGGDQHVPPEQWAVSGGEHLTCFIPGEIGLAGQRIGHEICGQHFGGSVGIVFDQMIDRIGIGRRRSLGLALLGQDRRAQQHFVSRDLGQRLGLVQQVIALQFGRIEIDDRAGAIARDQPGREPADPEAFAFACFKPALPQFRIRRGQQQCLEAQQLADRVPHRHRLGQAARAVFAAGHRAFIGIEHMDAARDQVLDVVLRGGMLPHPHIHRRHCQHWFISREQQRGRHIVSDAVRHLGEQIGRGRADDNQIGAARQLDVAHLDLTGQIPERGVHRVFAERGQGHRGDEFGAALGQHTADLAAALADQAHQLASLIGRDAAADDEQDPG